MTKIATWNVNSITARLPIVTRWLEAHRPDVLCLQETKCVDEKFPREAFAQLGYRAEIFGQPTYNGVALITRAECRDVQRNFPDLPPDAPQHARLLAAAVGDVMIVNVYVPNGASVDSDKYVYKLDWLKALREFFDARYAADQPVLLCGDFNVAPEDRDVYDPELWRGRVLFSEPEKRALAHVGAWGLTDAFRMFQQEGGHYSWWDYRAGAFRRDDGLRIDHIWLSAPLARRCVGAWIDREPRGWERPSDHTPVVAEFAD